MPKSNESPSLQALIQQLQDEVRGMWRFRWQALAAAWFILILGCLAVSLIPDRYQASSRFYVDASSRISPLVQGLAVETNPDTQVAYIRQMMLSRPHLTKLAQSPELARYARTPKERNDLVDMLRDNAQINSVSGGDSSRGLVVDFRFEYPNKDAALFVVQSLVDSFVEEARGSNVRKAGEAEEFVTKQLKDLGAKLSEIDAKIADFKRKNIGLLPGQGGDFVSQLQAEREAADNARNQLGILLSQRDTLAKQLSGQAPLIPGPTGTAGNLQVPGQNDLATRIKDSEAKLDDLLQRYTEKHPEVIALRATIADLKARRERELDSLRSGGAGSGSLSTSDNPVYQSIQQQISKLDVDIAAARVEVAQHDRRIADLQRSMNAAPAVEQELGSLQREQTMTKTEYERLFASLQRARISESAEESGVVNFQMIEPPVAKSKPVAPKRVLMLIGVLLASLGGGVALAFGMQQLRPVFSSIPAVAERLGLPVLGAVSYMGSAKTMAAARAGTRAYVAVFIAFLAVFAMALVLREWSAGLAELVRP